MGRSLMSGMLCLIVTAVLGLAGCGGGGGSGGVSAATATGKFVDAPVQGLRYVSGGQTGFTGPNGEFTYEVGKVVTFSVGGVVVGQAPGAGIVTPIDLVKTAAPGTTVTSSTPAVVRIAQFLLTASSLTSTGIKIDPVVTTASSSQHIDLSTVDNASFAAAINQIAVSAGNRNVTSAVAAENHLIASMAGLSSGTLVLPPASSLGGGYKITGVWRATNGAAFNYLILFDNNTFLYAENDLSAPATDNGVEVGTYTNNGTSITFNVTFDRNGPGYNSGVGEIGIPSTYDYNLSNSGNTLTAANGQLILNRVTFASSPISGVWQATAGAEFNYLVIFDDNTFLYAENDLAAPVTDNGVEVGTFTASSSSITFTVKFDHNGPGANSGVGEVGIPVAIGYSLSNDGKSLSVAGGELQLTKAF